MFLLPWPISEHNFSGFIFGRDLYNFSLLGAKEWCHAEIGTFFTTWFFYETSSKFFHPIIMQAHLQKLDKIPRQHLWMKYMNAWSMYANAVSNDDKKSTSFMRYSHWKCTLVRHFECSILFRVFIFEVRLMGTLRAFSKRFQLKQGGQEMVAREAGKDYFCAQGGGVDCLLSQLSLLFG